MRRNGAPLRPCLCLIWLFLFLAGCFPTHQPAKALQQQTPFFLPPTPQNITPSPREGSSAAEQPSPAVECKDQLRFLSDLTIPDGTVVSPDSTLDKRWEVENSGNCNWNEKYRIRLIAGPEMDAQKEQALYPARSGSRATIRLIFKAPLEPGQYRSAWQAFNARGEPFGDPFFIDIIVQ